MVVAVEDADAGTNPTLYVPYPMIGWVCPLDSAMVGQESSVAVVAASLLKDDMVVLYRKVVVVVW